MGIILHCRISLHLLRIRKQYHLPDSIKIEYNVGFLQKHQKFSSFAVFFLSSCHLKRCKFHFYIIISLTISDSHAGGANESNDGCAGRTLRPLHWTSEPTIPTIFPSTFIPLYDFGCTISVMFDVAVKRRLDAAYADSLHM